MTVLFLTIYGKGEPFALINTEPTSGVTVAPENSYIEFRFNKKLPLKQGAGFDISIIPNVDFLYVIDDNSLSINLTNILIDDATYSISVNNLYSVDEELLPITTASFRVEYSEVARSFIDNLPYSTQEFSINRVSEYGVFVLALSNPEEQRYEEAEAVMKQNGINTTLIQVGRGFFIDEELE